MKILIFLSLLVTGFNVQAQICNRDLQLQKAVIKELFDTGFLLLDCSEVTNQYLMEVRKLSVLSKDVLKKTDFEGLNNLYELHLYDSRLETDALKGARRLQRLHISDIESAVKNIVHLNSLRVLSLNLKGPNCSSAGFIQSQSLQAIELSVDSSAGCSPLKPYFFSKVPNLKRLRLDGGGQVTSDVFWGLKNLKVLQLFGGVSSLESNAFVHLENLEMLKLNFGWSGSGDVNLPLFSGLAKLTHLWFNVKGAYLPADDLLGLKNIQCIATNYKAASFAERQKFEAFFRGKLHALPEHWYDRENRSLCFPYAIGET